MSAAFTEAAGSHSDPQLTPTHKHKAVATKDKVNSVETNGEVGAVAVQAISKCGVERLEVRGRPRGW